VLGQDSACAILQEHLKKYDVSVELATELVSLEQDDNGIMTSLKCAGKEEKLRVKYLVGADGAKSASRKLAGMQLLGRSDKDTSALIMDAEINGLDRRVCCLYY
jgi:2-polyprenyl-6-methoxyphenol hydroxylase-like FAD-dependent oxidoreductase